MKSKLSEFFKYDIKKSLVIYIGPTKGAKLENSWKWALNTWILRKFTCHFFGLFKWINRIFIYGHKFVLFLVVECNNLIENISNSMVVMIFSSIKSWAGRWLNWYITKSLKIHKSLINFLIIKSYTIFRKQFLRIFEICYQKKVFSYI